MFVNLLLLLALSFVSFVRASLYFTYPSKAQSCTAGQDCTVQWLDDGRRPLLGSIGACTVGLYHGDFQLVQTIEPVNPATVHSLIFQPDATAGPVSDSYYIAFVSTSATVNGSAYVAYSGFFSIDGMVGSWDSPDSSATSSIPIPASVSSPPANIIQATETIGTLSTTTTASRMVTTTSVVSSPTSTSSASSSTPHSGAGRMATSPLFAVVLLSLLSLRLVV